MDDKKEIRERKKQIAEELMRRGLSEYEVKHILDAERYRELKTENAEKCLWEIIQYQIAKEILIGKYEYIMVRIQEAFDDLFERLEEFLEKHD